MRRKNMPGGTCCGGPCCSRTIEKVIVKVHYQKDGVDLSVITHEEELNASLAELGCAYAFKIGTPGGYVNTTTNCSTWTGRPLTDLKIRITFNSDPKEIKLRPFYSITGSVPNAYKLVHSMHEYTDVDDDDMVQEYYWEDERYFALPLYFIIDGDDEQVYKTASWTDCKTITDNDIKNAIIASLPEDWDFEVEVERTNLTIGEPLQHLEHENECDASCQANNCEATSLVHTTASRIRDEYHIMVVLESTSAKDIKVDVYNHYTETASADSIVVAGSYYASCYTVPNTNSIISNRRIAGTMFTKHCCIGKPRKYIYTHPVTTDSWVYPFNIPKFRAIATSSAVRRIQINDDGDIFYGPILNFSECNIAPEYPCYVDYPFLPLIVRHGPTDYPRDDQPVIELQLVYAEDNQDGCCTTELTPEEGTDIKKVVLTFNGTTMTFDSEKPESDPDLLEYFIQGHCRDAEKQTAWYNPEDSNLLTAYLFRLGGKEVQAEEQVDEEDLSFSWSGTDDCAGYVCDLEKNIFIDSNQLSKMYLVDRYTLITDAVIILRKNIDDTWEWMFKTEVSAALRFEERRTGSVRYKPPKPPGYGLTMQGIICTGPWTPVNTGLASTRNVITTPWYPLSEFNDTKSGTISNGAYEHTGLTVTEPENWQVTNYSFPFNPLVCHQFKMPTYAKITGTPVKKDFNWSLKIDS